MRITKQRRAFIEAVKKDFQKQKATTKVIAKLYNDRYQVFDNDSEIVGLVEIAIDEYIKEHKLEIEYGVELALLKINK